MREVLEILRKAEVAIWTDEGLEPGTSNWQNAISEAIKQSQTMVVLLSPDANASMWVRNEISLALTLDKRIFPLLIAGDAATAVPISLISTQWLDGRHNLGQAVTIELVPLIQQAIAGAGASEPLPKQRESAEELKRRAQPRLGKFTGKQVTQIRDALLDAYPTMDSLRMMVRIELDENLVAIAGDENPRVIVFNLITWAERTARIDDLIAGAVRQNPNNQALQQLAQDWRSQS